MVDSPFSNASPFHAEALPMLDRQGRECRLVVVKATFDVTDAGSARLAESQRPLRYGDELWGPPEVEDLRFPGDLSLFKPGTDVVVAGYAYAPLGKRVLATDVSLELPTRSKRLRVHGPRVWESAFLAVRPSPLEPLTRMAVRWGNAFGGTDMSNPEKPLEEARNPAGSGIAHDTESLVGQPAPTIEDPSDPVTSAGSRCRPIGIAPIGRTFVPRRGLAGTYDDNWLKNEYPARPHDYQPEHENCAPADQHFDEPWKGNERIQVIGMSEGGPLLAIVPAWRIVIEMDHSGQVTEHRPHLDTVVFDTEARLLELVWRHVVAIYQGSDASLERIIARAKAVR